jgi:uncharacterized membrane protein YcjF (UPF0283 family)
MAAARILLVENETLLRLVAAKVIRDDGSGVVASQHDGKARALLDDPDDSEARASESATAQAQFDALTGRAVKLAAVIERLENPAVSPSAPASDAACAAATGPVPLPAPLDAQTIGLLRVAS